MIPKNYKQMFCNMEKIEFCDFYMHKDCEETCGFAKDIAGLGKKVNDTLVEAIKDLTNGNNGEE